MGEYPREVEKNKPEKLPATPENLEAETGLSLLETSKVKGMPDARLQAFYDELNDILQSIKEYPTSN